jgi:lysophospholipase L1-like esterase
MTIPPDSRAFLGELKQRVTAARVHVVQAPNNRSVRVLRTTHALLAAVFLLTGFFLAAAAPPAAQELKSVILIGDSIRMGYEKSVMAELAGQANVSGPTENCRHSGEVLKNLKVWVLDKKPSLVHMNAGLHEIYRNTNGVRQLSVERYTNNLDLIFQHLADAGIKVIWSTTTPVMDDRYLKTKGYVCRVDRDVEAYNQAALGILKKHGIPVLDLHAAVASQNKESIYSADGVHFNSDGSRFLARHVADYIMKHINPAPRK